MSPSERAELLAQLGRLNKNLRKNGVSPIFHKKNAETFADDQLTDALEATKAELVKSGIALSEL